MHAKQIPIWRPKQYGPTHSRCFPAPWILARLADLVRLPRRGDGHPHLSSVHRTCEASFSIGVSSLMPSCQTIGLSRQGHLSAACGTQNSLSNFDIWIFVGEWTLAITDCAKYLNGRGVGARYDGSYPGSTYIGSCGGMTGSGSSFSSDYKSYLRQFWEAQVISYEKGDGWLFWTWKAENADEWSYQAGLNYGWIPSDPTDLQYPDICG